MSTLEIKDLYAHVETKDGIKPILKGVNLTVNSGETHAIMGPNGSGKSTLAYTLAGHPKYIVDSGQVLLDGENILKMTPDERAKAGIFLAMQYPVEVPGVSMTNFLRTAKTEVDGKAPAIRTWTKELSEAMKRLKMDPKFATRSVNEGFSGGEKKRAEVLQLELLKPKFAIMDPELTKTLPDYQTESGCADIMMHTMERYFTNGGNMELTDALAEGLLRTVMKNAVILHTDPANYEARAEVMWAGSLSHNGLTGCGIARGDFMSHKLEHEMGGMFDVTHGAGLAALWPSWARYVYKDCLPRFVRFARNVMGVTTDGTDEEIALKGIDAMVDFYHSIGMPASFHELGIAPTDAQIDEMARRCREASGSALGSAKKLDLDDMIAIYRAANH